MSWVPKERTIFSVVQCAWQFQTSHPAIFQVLRVSVNPGLMKIITKITGAAIHLSLDEELRLPGYLLKKREILEYTIVLARNSTWCWKRFTLCKELCHVLTDDGSVYARSAIEQLAHAIKIRQAFNALAKLNSEEFCFLLAIELMIPLQRRLEIGSRVKKGEPDFNIANDLKMPEWIINYYYKQTPLADTTDALRLAFGYHEEDRPPFKEC